MKKNIIFLIFCLLLALHLFAQINKYPKKIWVGHDSSSNYTSIQDAINSVRDLGQWQVIIYIKKGVYHEKIVIPSWKTKISLIGEDKDSTIITNNDYSGKTYPNGKDICGKDKFSTFTSYTILVQGNDFVAENLTIINNAGRVAQAVALHIEGDRAKIKNCKILGNQDTLYVASTTSRQLYTDCYIEGTTDFIFGEATVVFNNCVIKSLTESYITAAATSAQQKFGFVFLNCKLIADTTLKKIYLGRPWRNYAKTVFIHCNLGLHIIAQGWDPWKGDAMFVDKEKTAFYAEYANTGLGSSTQKRVVWAKQLTAQQAKVYTIKNILQGYDNWQP